MKYKNQLTTVVLLIAALPLVAQAHRPQPKNPHPSASAATSAESDRGQQVFEQNCSRCHNAPEGFSSSISGTVAMHMRARANLSQADYKALRRFLNP